MGKDGKNRLRAIYKQSKLKPPYTHWPFARRFWVFQNERVPILAIALIAFSVMAAVASNNNNLVWRNVVISGLMVTLYLLQIRLSDEPKDFEHDNEFYPNRPVQRGLITLKELSVAKNVTIVAFFGLALLTGSIAAVVLAFVVQGYSYLTRNEFFVRDWLRQHFFIYQFSHYIQILFLDWLALTILDIQPLSDKLIYFVYAIILFGMVESSRTIGGSDGSDAKDRYSYMLGVNVALLWFVGFTVAVCAYTIFLISRSSGRVFWLILLAGTLAVSWSIIKYRQRPTMKNAELMNMASVVMYLCATTVLYLA